MTAVTRNYLTIVSGLPRSGTSMMMRMLDMGGLPVMIDEIREADEDNPRGYYEFEPVKQTQKDASWVSDSPGKCVKMVYSLLYDMPADYSYRVLFMRREMSEVLASQRVMLERHGTETGGAAADEQMAALFRSQLADFENWVAEQSNIEMIEVSYNRMLSEPEAEISNVNAFLDGDLDTEAMRAVVEPQLYRNRS